MTQVAPKLDGRGWALLLALAVLWSVSFVFMKVAAADIPVLTLVLVRVGLAAVVLHAIARATKRRFPAEPRLLARYALMGLLNNILPFGLIVYATAQIGAGAASILNATAPIFALLVAHVATDDDKITPAKLAGILLGLAGVVAMVGAPALAGLSGELVPAAAMLLATFSYGLAASVGRSFRGADPIVSATTQLTASTLILAPIALSIDLPWTLAPPGPAALSAAVALALLSTALAYVIFFALISRAGATNTILVTLLIPAGGVFFGWLLLGEHPRPNDLLGMLLIGSGLVAIDGRVLARTGGGGDRHSVDAGRPPRPPRAVTRSTR
jgi:drug/metabolite transporter (DMT)-like permease